jgi:hypothetical protein
MVALFRGPCRVVESPGKGQGGGGGVGWRTSEHRNLICAVMIIRMMPLDPFDQFIASWYENCKEIESTPLPPERAHDYYLEFDLKKGKFLQDFLNRSEREYTWRERQELERLATKVKIAIDKSIALYNKQQNKHKIEELKHKKGFFDNAKLFFFNLFGRKE